MVKKDTSMLFSTFSFLGGSKFRVHACPPDYRRGSMVVCLTLYRLISQRLINPDFS
jgi:hypothetical protein